MLRTAVCDDDKSFLKSFCALAKEAFERCGQKCDISPFSDSSLLLKVHRAQAFGAVFLDIDMPSVNGFAAAKAIAAQSPDCCIIFVTSHNELVYDSFEFRPLNFIVKQEQSLMRPRLDRVIRQLCAALEDSGSIVLEDGLSGRFSVRLSDIIYIESSDHDVLYRIRGRAEPVRVRERISRLEEEYSPRGFVRVHKKYLVNLRHVFNIDLTRECVLLKTGGELPLSRHYKAAADSRLTDYLRNGR